MIKSAISPKAVTLRLAACSTDRISADALAVCPAAVWMLPAISRVVVLCSSTAIAMLEAAIVNCSMARVIEEISSTDFLVAS